MRSLRAALSAAVLFVLAACGSNGSNTFPEAVITSVNPTEFTPGGEITVTGRNYYAVTGAGSTRIEACGVSLNGSLVEPQTRSILLPPGSTMTAEVGNTITGTLPAEGLVEGLSDVRVTRPDGSTAVIENAVICVFPATEPVAEPTPVTANFTTSSSTTVAPAIIVFNAADSTGEGELEYAWDFGIEGAAATGAEAAFEYLQAGTYMVMLTVTDETGATAEATQVITIHPALKANFTRSGLTGFAPVTIHFDATSSTGIAPLTYAWDFGDEIGTSSEAQPSYEYLEGGTYTVTLTVTDANGLTDTATADVHIPTAVMAVITADTIIGTAPLTVTFSALNSTGEGELRYAWDFGVEGSLVSSEAQPAFTFNAGGDYQVELTVVDETGASDVTTQTIAVDVIPGNITLTVEPAELQYISTVLVTGDSYSSTVTLPGVLTDLAPGSYTVTPEPYERTDTFNDQVVRSTWTAATQSITVSEGQEVAVVLEYEAETGVLDLAFTGLPEGNAASVSWSIAALDTPLGLFADTDDLTQLQPGLYRLWVGRAYAYYGSRQNDTDWYAAYEPDVGSVDLVVSSGSTVNQQIEFTVIRVGDTGMSSYTNLPDRSRPTVILRDSNDVIHDRPWRDLIPGHYRLEYVPFDYERAGGVVLHDESTARTYEQYAPDVNPEDQYLSSRQNSAFGAEFRLKDAMLEIVLDMPEGNRAAEVTISDSEGTVLHRFIGSADVRLPLRIGEYRIGFSEMPGYDVITHGVSPDGYFLLDTSHYFGGVQNTVEVAVSYEPAAGLRTRQLE